MILTEDKKNNSGFDSTQTFSVASHSADTLKKMINEKNGQGLEKKNSQNASQAKPREKRPSPARQISGADGQMRVKPRPQATGERNPRQNPAGARQNHVRDVNIPADRVHGNLAAPSQATVKPNTGLSQIPHTQAHRPITPAQNSVHAPASDSLGRAEQPMQRPMNSAASNPQRTETPPQIREARALGQTQHPELRRQNNLREQKNADGTQRASRENPRNPQSVRAEDEGKPLSARILENQARKKTEEEKKKREKSESKKMMKTVTNQLSLTELSAKQKYDDDDDYESDVGGNTVISVVKAIVYIVSVLVVSVFLSLAIILVGNDIFAFVKSDEVVEVTVPEYATLNDIANILYENDIIKYPQIFKLYAVANKDSQKYVAGTYSVNGMMNYDALLLEFKEKVQTGTIKITIPEGYTTDEIIELFVSNGIGTKEEFVDVIENYDFDYWFVKELEEKGTKDGRIYRLDGYLFPDTYEFYKNSSAYTVVNKLLRRFQQIFTKEYRKQCEVFGYTVDEVITLASIIEKEASAPSEFFTVSSVFHNRLNNPANFPRLESDATVVYAIHHATGVRSAMKPEDKFYESPYNTYIHDKLPPGPIANPSASAMLAALSPQDTDYYFFVSYGSRTYFSSTKAQHDAYIAEFQRQNAEASETTPEN